MKKQILILIAILFSFTIYAQNNITTIEYYFDVEPNVGNGTSLSVTPGNLINETYSFDISTLSVGFHFICIRAKNEQNIWSLYDRKVFYISEPYIQNISPIVAAEYYIDTDLGIGSGTTIPLSNPIDDHFTFDITTPNLTDGEHLLFIRIKSQDNVWSLYDVVAFTVDSSLSIADNDLENNIAIYPNPIKDKINFTSRNTIISYKIIDITGKAIIESNIVSHSINTSVLETGTYFLILKLEKSTSVKKIIKH